jgi:N-sulfoglucosamine sulfohydrolase
MGLTNAGFAMESGISNLPTILYDQGYFTGLIGKVHVEPESELHFDVTDKRNTRESHLIASLVEQFISRQDSMPFFLMVNLADPHKTRHQYMGAVQVNGIPSIPLNESDVEPFDFIGLNTKPIRIVTAGYYNCVKRIDFSIGLLMEVLDQHQVSENTFIMFLSDHGPPFTRAKTTCYEAGLRIPFIIKWPGQSSRGIVRDEMVSTVDILPTILDAVGVDPVDNAPGRSLIPLLDDKSVEWRGTLCAEYNAHDAEGFYPRRSIRDDRYKLILNLLPEQENPYEGIDGCPAWITSRHDSLIGTEIRQVYDTYRRPSHVELYDLQEDPNEWNNLADLPRYDKVKHDLLERLNLWRKSTNDPYLDPERLNADRIKYLGA